MRTKLLNGKRVQLTSSEESERDAEDAAHDSKAGERSRAAALVADRAGLRSKWDALPDFITGPYGSDFDIVNKFLDEGKKGQAVARIEFADPRAKFTQEQKDLFESVQKQFVTAISNLDLS